MTPADLQAIRDRDADTLTAVGVDDPSPFGQCFRDRRVLLAELDRLRAELSSAIHPCWREDDVEHPCGRLCE